MQLSKRLQTVADLVSPGNRVADVGCDHAYTAIYLAERGAPGIVAMDVNQGPIERAIDNVTRYGFSDQIQVRKSNGLEKLEPGEADTIVIAGMGGGLMVQILSAREELTRSVKELVLQPQSDIHRVRQLVIDYGFAIMEEAAVFEDGKYYFMIKAKRVSEMDDLEVYRLSEEVHYHYGRLLLEQGHPVLLDYLRWDLGICEEIILALDGEDSESAKQRLLEIQQRIQLIQRGLTYNAQ